MSEELEVRLAGQTVGHLTRVGPERHRFTYLGGAALRGVPYPVSLALPRSRLRHEGEAVDAVFEGLLPDGDLRRRLARSLGLSRPHTLEMLAHVGRECHGALTLRRAANLFGGEPARPHQPPRLLEARELRDAMAALLLHPLLAEADGLAKTLPGEYDKLPVRLVDGKVAIVLDDALTTHIAKPARPGLRESVHNEAFCMALAGAYGLPVAPTRVLRGPNHVLLVERIDRRESGDRVEAVHMEDFCQALGRAPARKYEREGGPRLADIAKLLRRVSVQPAVDLRALVRWVVFGFLVGFGAAHARQLALVLTADGPRLAPFFGLWSTHCYGELSFRMGLRIGVEDRPDWLTAARWAECGEALGVRPRYVLEELERAALSLPRLAAEVAEDFQGTAGYAEIVAAIRTLIEQRARQALVSLEAERSLSASDPPVAGGSTDDEQSREID